MNSNKKFSIIVPVYQNEPNLNNTIPQLIALEHQLKGYSLELVFVDDGSTDNSYDILIAFHKRYPEKIKIAKHTRNFGQNPAIQTGLKISSGNCVGIISADLQDPPDLFIEMIHRWEKGTKLVIAERTDRKEKYIRKLISNLYWKMVANYAIKDFPVGGFDFCLMDHQLKEQLLKIPEKNPVIFPLIFWLGYSYEIIPYTRRSRSFGKSQWTISKKIKLSIDTFIGFTYLPVRLISLLGIIIFALSMLYSLIILGNYIFSQGTLKGWSTVVILISAFGGINLLSIGVIGEYLWRILDESRSRPNSIVDSIINTQIKK